MGEGGEVQPARIERKACQVELGFESAYVAS